MKIVSCFSELKEIPALVEAGASELYCAVSRFPAYGSAALLDRGKLKKAVKAAHSCGARIALAANSMFIPYGGPGLKRLLDGIQELDATGMDAFIISSPALFTLLKTRRPLRAALHLSSIQPCFNTSTAELFISCGVKRLILPNQLSGAEAAPILKFCAASGVETEIFDYRFFGCTYVNGRCKLHRQSFHTFRRIKEGAALCRSGAAAGQSMEVKSFDTDPARMAELREVSARVAARMGCGGPLRIADSGDFFDYFASGADFLKYGTRSDPSETKIRKVRAMRAMIELAGALRKNAGAKKARTAFTERMSRWDPHAF